MIARNYSVDYYVISYVNHIDMEELKGMGKLDANIFSEYIVKMHGPMSHLKLQKLLFYCEAYHLAYFDEAMLNQEFQAWVHGPVCVEVYHKLKDKSKLYSDLKYVSDGNEPDDIIKDVLTSKQIELVSDILSTLSTWTDLELEDATHNEQPWIDARRGYAPAEICNEIISKELMRVFYKSELSN